MDRDGSTIREKKLKFGLEHFINKVSHTYKDKATDLRDLIITLSSEQGVTVSAFEALKKILNPEILPLINVAKGIPTLHCTGCNAEKTLHEGEKVTMGHIIQNGQLTENWLDCVECHTSKNHVFDTQVSNVKEEENKKITALVQKLASCRALMGSNFGGLSRLSSNSSHKSLHRFSTPTTSQEISSLPKNL